MPSWTNDDGSCSWCAGGKSPCPAHKEPKRHHERYASRAQVEEALRLLWMMTAGYFRKTAPPNDVRQVLNVLNRLHGSKKS